MAEESLDGRWWHFKATVAVLGFSYICHRRRQAAAKREAEEKAKKSEAKGPVEDWRFELVRSVGEECQKEGELRGLLKMKRNKFQLYDGFEPSGRMHIAQGVFKALNVNKCTKAGGTFLFWVADWFALMNDKMGGDLDKIKVVGEYLIEVWKATGMDMSRVKFLWSSDEITKNAEKYWGQALDIARRSTLARIKKCCQIMGRKEDTLTAAQIMYPIMQATDVFFLEADICQLGVDQRKVNMLARDYCDLAARKKPVILSHHMLYGLKAGQSKMSKSDPDSAIFMEDTPEDVERKIRNAYCPLKPESIKADDDEMHLVKDDLMNPCLDYLKYILFSKEGFTFEVEGVTYTNYDDARAAFVAGKISEKALKDRLIVEINALLEPVRKHFTTDAKAKELLGKVRQWKKETLVPPVTCTRLKVIDSNQPPVHAVFAPLPTETVNVEAVIDVVRRLKAAPEGSTTVLWFEDWTASTLGKLDGNATCIKGWYELLLHGVRSVAPEVMRNVRVCWQGECILSDASAYWISVINAGRRCSVETVRSFLPPGSELEYASQVLACLMHIGDVLALTGDSDTQLCCDRYHESLHRLAVKDVTGQKEKVTELTVPTVTSMEMPSLRLVKGEEKNNGKNMANILLTDSEATVGDKMKKAFCEPGNAEFCPPLKWAQVLLELKGELRVSRWAEKGGDKTYTSFSELQQDFVAGAVHPADVKPAVSSQLNALLSQSRVGLKSEAQLVAAQDALAALAMSLAAK